MKRNRHWTGIFAALIMLVLILDSKTAISSAKAGVGICLATVIPSLFPFIILSGLITSAFVGNPLKILKPVGRICRIPAGGESLLLIGLIGGYPVGGQCIYRAYRDGQLSKQDAERMLGFCNNAGPAFIFGITAALFDSSAAGWIIWGIQILSAVVVGILLPGYTGGRCTLAAANKQSISGSMEYSVKTMGIICSWIVSAKILIGFLDKWILYPLPIDLAIAIEGLVELSNGCLRLAEISEESIRFTLASTLLSAGGLCVWLQIFSVTGELGKRTYMIGKCLQTVICIGMSAIMSQILYPGENHIHGVIPGLILIFMLAIFIVFKKVVALRKKVLYNV